MISPGYDYNNGKYASVYALVRGRVWATTTGTGSISEGDPSGSYGRMMLIKGDDDKLYLLGHLSEYRKNEGEDVFPGDIVAVAGNTGHSTGPHLHLEVITCNTGMSDRDMELVLDITMNKKHPSDGGTSKNAAVLAWKIHGYFSKYSLKDARLNPLTGEKK